MKNHEDGWREELASHRTLRADYGATPEEGRRRFGNRSKSRKPSAPSTCRSTSISCSKQRSPLFTAAATLTLALGLGAATAVFYVVARIHFRPLPYAQPDRLV